MFKYSGILAKQFIYNRQRVRLASGFDMANFSARKNWRTIFQELKEKETQEYYIQPRISLSH